MGKVFIVAAKRTATGSFLGTLKNVSPADLGATVVKQLIADTNVPADKIDELISGIILSAGQSQGVARQVAVKAGIPHEVPSFSINMLCGSGMKAVLLAYDRIKAGSANVIVAGGTENMSGAPFLLPKNTRQGIKLGQFAVEDHMVLDALTDAFEGIHMGITAENIAEKYNISRQEQDQFAIQSQTKAAAAVDSGKFVNEIVPVKCKVGREEIEFATDEYVNRSTSLEKLAKLRPAFKKDGTVTAGNASGINDGASFCMVASEEAVKQYNLTPLVEIVAVGQAGCDPNFMGMGPVPAIKKALDSAKMKLSEMEIVELNEAFAAQSLGVVEQLCADHKIDKKELLSKTNQLGGAIALGHPVGASGNRILVTLIHQLISGDKKVGLASLCIGGGLGTAIIVKKV